MRARLTLGSLTAAAALFALSFTLTAQQSSPAEVAWSKAPPVIAFEGSYCKVTQRRYERVMIDDVWSEVWSSNFEHHVERDSYDQLVYPKIDFDNFMVLAIFNGESWNTRSMILVESAEVNGELHIRFDANAYQTASLEMKEITIEGEVTPEKVADAALRSMEEEDAKREAGKHADPNFTTAYGMFVLPRNDKPIVLFENTQGLIGHPPIWTEVHRFAALK